MNRAWPTENGWCSQVRQFQGSVCTWNKHVFGNIFERKRSLIRGLEDVDKRLNVSPSLILEEEQKSLWLEYEKVLAQEELLWYKKFRSKWLHSGDRNTKYFHGITAVRRKNNSYDIMQDDGGNWARDTIQIESLVSNYYKDLFSEEGTRDSAFIYGAFPKLSLEELKIFDKEITRGDIFNVISHMGSLKAPGPDGLQAGFTRVNGRLLALLFASWWGKSSTILERSMTLMIPSLPSSLRLIMLVELKTLDPSVCLKFPTKSLQSYWLKSSVWS